MACPGVRAEKLSSQRLSCQSKLALPPPEKRANEAYHSSLLRAWRGGRVQAESGGRKPDLTKALKSEALRRRAPRLRLSRCFRDEETMKSCPTPR